MFVKVNGTKLFFDVVGVKLDLAHADLREKPTLVALHGGPGLDHLVLRPFFDRFADIAQVVYIDLRGNGRSIGSRPESWTLAQWGDDVKAFCDQLGIERPIVLGQSFGGFVAQSYATLYPSHPGGLILSSTAARMDLEAINARIEKAGGSRARSVAERHWNIGDVQSLGDFEQVVMPLFVTLSNGPNRSISHTIKRPEVGAHFHRPPDGEIRRMDFRKALANVQCRTLVLSGGPGDLITPPEGAREIVDALPETLVRFECLAHCRHGVFRDDPAASEEIIRSFLTEVVTQERAKR